MRKFFLPLAFLIINTDLAAQENGFATMPKASFWDYQLVERPVSISGALKGYDGAIDSFSTAHVEYEPLLQSSDYGRSTIFEISHDGSFSFDIPLASPKELLLVFGDEMITIYAVPGNVHKLTVNWNDIKRQSKLPLEQRVTPNPALSFSGDLAELNQSIYEFVPATLKILSYPIHQPMIKSLDAPAYKQFRTQKMREQLAALSEYQTRSAPGRDFEIYMTNRIVYDAFNDLIRYRYLHDPSIADNGHKKLPELTEDYKDFINDESLNNINALLTNNYSSWLHELIADLLFLEEKTTEFSFEWKELADFLSEERLLTEQEVGLLAQIIEAEARNDSLAIEKLTPRLMEFGGKYQGQMLNLASWKLNQKNLREIDSTFGDGIGKDIIMTRIYAQTMSEAGISFNEEKLTAQLDTLISSTAITEYILEKNRQIRAYRDRDFPEQSQIITPLNAKQTEFFKTLIKPYEGKVIYIDFWAPWCGPCMSEMPNSQMLQQELSGKDIVFLYLGVSCTKDSWEVAVKNKEIKGEHYLCNKDEYNLLSDKFNIIGIPHYVLVDKTGKVVDPKAPEPGEKDELLSKINSLL